MAFINLLQYHNVTRVALIYGPETAANNISAYQNSPYNIKKYILSSKIQLLASIPVPYRLENKNDEKNIFGLLKSSDARFLIRTNMIIFLIKYVGTFY
jgi:hypothetical protein